MKVTLILILGMLAAQTPAPQVERHPPRENPARMQGPEAKDLARREDLSPHEVLAKMFNAIEARWIPAEYEKARTMEWRARLNAEFPAAAVDARLKGQQSMRFNLDVNGYAAPNGRYSAKVSGDFGDIEQVNDLQRKYLSSQDFKAFSDSPIRTRSPNANLTNYRSLLLRYIGQAKNQIMESGAYRSVYVGQAVHEGWEVDVVRVYKPVGNTPVDHKAPMAIERMWTFWKDGGYEIWVHRGNSMPAVIFYTNVYDNIYANFQFDYDDNWMPRRLSYRNNSVGSEGQGDLVLTFDRSGMLNGASLKFESDEGISINLDATLAFLADDSADRFRIAPPFGFKKLNQSHLKLMVLTQISGSLLKLKSYGLNLKNFKF